MEISLTEAKAQLTELVRRAESGEAVYLTRRGKRVAQILPFQRAARARDLRGLAAELSRSAKANVAPGTTAARSADFLYDEDGEP
ncbi:type II toxin-antitoxin system Phd/YefM family antitoxin [Rubrimonas sp.]|uniref:type II toxin-antitoxin system Phd/YefM family antitoxin n=1 Tax=Rubrimonas sp. TaxID=2036015 RepID=UPI002FDECCC2